MSGLRTPEVWAKLTGLGLGLAVGAQAATEMFAWPRRWPPRTRRSIICED